MLTDPLLRDRVLHIRRHAPTPSDEVAHDIDAVLISHTHPDHFDPPSVRRIAPGRLVVPAGSGRIMSRRGFDERTELATGDRLAIAGAQINAVTAHHDGRRWPVGRRIRSIGYLVEAGGLSVYFAGDTAPFDEVGEVAPDVDVALLPIWGWNSSLHERFHLSPRTAAEAAAALRARVVIPIHWGTLLQIGLGKRREELFERPLREFAENLASLAPDAELRALRPGESTTLDLPAIRGVGGQ